MSKYLRYLSDVKDTSQEIRVAKEDEVVRAFKTGNLHMIAENGRKIKLENVVICKNLSDNPLSVKKREKKYNIIMSFPH